jgi:hypothetical protein
MTGIRTLDDLSQAAPMHASASLNLTVKLFEDVANDASLMRDRILQTTAVFTDMTKFHDVSLSNIDTRLSEVAGQFHTYLTDIRRHLELIVLKKTVAREDFSSVSQLSSDIDSIQQRLIAIPFDIIEFHKRHEEELALPNAAANAGQSCLLIRSLAITGHKTWLIYQVEFIKSAMQSIIRLYSLVADPRR